jgi:hypothetical protein
MRWGVAAALDWLATPAAQTTATLSTLWGMTELDEEASALCALILQARAEIEQWRIEDCPTL